MRWRERIRMMIHHPERGHTVNERVPVLIYGAGRRGKAILKELRENRSLGLHPIGWLDDNPDLIGATVRRVRILGSSRDLGAILSAHKVSALIISSYKITSERLVPVLDLCSKQRIPVLRGEFQLDRVSAVRVPARQENPDQSQHLASDVQRNSVISL